MCSYQEFLEQTKKPNFEQDDGWQGIDEQQIYSEQEYEAYERRRQEEIQKMVAKGMVRTHMSNNIIGISNLKCISKRVESCV